MYRKILSLGYLHRSGAFTLGDRVFRDQLCVLCRLDIYSTPDLTTISTLHSSQVQSTYRKVSGARQLVGRYIPVSKRLPWTNISYTQDQGQLPSPIYRLGKGVFSGIHHT